MNQRHMPALATIARSPGGPLRYISVHMCGHSFENTPKQVSAFPKKMPFRGFCMIPFQKRALNAKPVRLNK